MEFILFAAAILFFLVAAQYIAYFRVLLASELHSSAAVLCTRKYIPQAKLALLDDGATQLAPIGFELSHYVRRREIFAAATEPRFIAVFYHADHKCYAELSPHYTPDTNTYARIEFVSFSPQHTVITMGGMAAGVMPGFDRMRCFDETSEDIKTRLQKHLQHVADVIAEADANAQLLVLPSDTYRARSAKDEREYLKFLLDRGYAHEKAGHLKLSVRGAAKLLRPLMRGDALNQRLRQTSLQQPKPTPAFLQQAEVSAFLRQEQIVSNARWSGWGKAALFAVSVMAFALLFGAAFSPRMVVVLVPVLVFHELGHIVAMRAFGYRDLQILFLPIGAAALGEKDEAPAWQRIIVSLAGPVPGLLLALFIVSIVPNWQDQNWIYELVLILTILNYLNLLPFMPLDGGQVVNLSLFDRFPHAQLGFQFVSMAVFLLGAWLIPDPILGILGIFIGLSLFAQYRDPKLLEAFNANSTTRNGAERATNKTRTIGHLFSLIEDQAIVFEQKLNVVKRLLPRVLQTRPRTWECWFGIFIYLIALLLPVVVVAERNGVLGFLGHDFQDGTAASFTDERWSPQYWDQRLTQTIEPRARYEVAVKAYETLMEGEAYEKILPFLNTAITLAEEEALTQESRFPDLIAARIGIMANDLENRAQVTADLRALKSLLAPGDERIANAHVSIGIGFSELEHLSHALAIYESADAEFMVSSVLTSMASIHEEDGDQDSAEAHLIQASKVVDEQLENHGGASALADYYVRRGRLGEAAKIHEDLLQQDNEWFDRSSTFDDLAWIALEQNKLDTAGKMLEERDLARSKERQELQDSIGFLPRLFLGKHIGAVSAPHAADYEAHLVLAHKRGEFAARDQHIESMRESLQTIGDMDINGFIAQRRRIAENASGIYANALYARRARAVIQALEGTLN